MLYTSIFLNFLVSLLLIKYQWKLNKGVIYLFIILITVNIRQITLLLLNQTSYTHELAFLFLHLDPFVCLLGPAVIYYFFSLTKGKIELDFKIILFCIPSILIFINLLPYFGTPFSQKLIFIGQVQSTHNVDYIPFPYLFLDLSLQRTCIAIYNLLCQLYIVYCLIKMIRAKGISPAFGALMKNLLLILSISIFSFAFLIFHYRFKLDIFSNASNGIFEAKDFYYLFTLVLPVSFFVVPTWLYGLDSPSFIKSNMTNQNKYLNNKDQLISAKKSFSKSDDLDRILDYIKSEKPFLNFDFSIHDISGSLKLPQIRVSNSFNNQLKIPFPAYRNMCRVEYFLNLYESNTFPNYSIEGLARESGFQTKSSFYAAFKSVHNMTPMQYISKKELQKV